MQGRNLITLISLSVASAGCVSGLPNPMASLSAVDGPGRQALLDYTDAETPRNLPKSRSGNPPTYEVFGKQYHVMESAEGYRDTGDASWYGSKFHGRKTSSGEVYDMYQMTAAHRSLPLPTFVKVTNLENGQELVVKVNDRGPFHDERIIDLSYAAAAKLGIVESGTAAVEVVAISNHEDTVSGVASATAAAEQIPGSKAPTVVQVGAFSEQKNAESMRTLVNKAMEVEAAYIQREQHNNLYHVRFGIAQTVSLPDVFAQLEHHGIANYRVIED